MAAQQQQSRHVEVPKDQNLAQQAAAPVATLSSNVDPWPHYIMAGASAGASALAYSRGAASPRGAAIGGAFALAYLFAGRLVVQGHEKLGYDVGTLTSGALAATTYNMMSGPAAPYAAAAAATGGISFIANAIKSYQARTGKPHEVEEKKH